MDDRNSGFLKDLLRRGSAIEPLPDIDFDESVKVRLIKECSLSHEQLSEVSNSLTDLRTSYQIEKQVFEANEQEMRSYLDKVSKASDKLAKLLSDMPTETSEAMISSRRYRTVANDFSDKDLELAGIPKTKIEAERETIDGLSPNLAPELSDLQSGLSILSKSAEAAKLMVGGGRAGPRPDYSVLALMKVVIYIWVDIFEREFTLDWSEQAEPASEAALFCFEVAMVIDPQIDPTKIQSAARNVRENWDNIQELAKMAKK